MQSRVSQLFGGTLVLFLSVACSESEPSGQPAPLSPAPSASSPPPVEPPPNPLTDASASPDAPAPENDSGPADAAIPDGALNPNDADTDAGGMDAGPDPVLPPEVFPIDNVTAAAPERIIEVSDHIEGPSVREGDLFFAHDGYGALMRLSLTERQLYRYHPSIRPIGTFLLGDGSILLCVFPSAGKPEVVLQLRRDGSLAVLEDGSAPFCNDLTVDRDGNIFFSDFRAAIYRITPDGEQSEALEIVANGLEVDPSGDYLYINQRGGGVFRSAIDEQGSLGDPEAVIDAAGDGSLFDYWGNYWLADFAAGEIAIVDPAERRELHRIDIGGGTTNLTWAGAEADVLYVTSSRSGVYRVPFGVPGFGFKGHAGAEAYIVRRVLDATPADELVE